MSDEFSASGAERHADRDRSGRPESPLRPQRRLRWRVRLAQAQARVDRALRTRRPRRVSLLNAIGITVLLAAGFLAAFVYLLSQLLGVRIPVETTKPAEIEAGLAIVRLAAVLVAGVGGVVALTVAFRRQQALEVQHDGLRFEAIATQLGDPDPAVRVAGVYAAARLADESDIYRPVVVDLLCAYLRLNRADDGPVQQTILTVMAARLHYDSKHKNWGEHPIDLHGVVFEEDVVFSFCVFERDVRFDGAQFRGRAEFTMTTFEAGLWLDRARFEATADFRRSEFNDDVIANDVFLKEVSFTEVTFRRGVQFNRVDFSDYAYFSECRFLNGVVLDGSQADAMLFESCLFTRGTEEHQSDAVHKGGAYFRNLKTDSLNLKLSRFETAADFSGSVIGSIRLEGTKFQPLPYFESATIRNGLPHDIRSALLPPPSE